MRGWFRGTIGWPLMVAAIAGLLAGWTVSMWLFGLWFDLGWRKPVADWLLAHGYVWLVPKWGLIWINMPYWALMSVAASILSFVWPRRWFGVSTTFAFSLVAAPYTASWLLGVDWASIYGIEVLVKTLLWDVAGIPVAWLSAWLVSRPLRRRVPLGHCRHCGYNLIHNTSGICPECGNKIKTPVEQQERAPAE